MKRLRKSQEDRKISGVCAGIAEYINVDPTVIRLLWILLTVCTVGFGGVIGYIVCAMVMPD